MEVLQELGLINARQGRGGAKISVKGELFLERNTDLNGYRGCFRSRS